MLTYFSAKEKSFDPPLAMSFPRWETLCLLIAQLKGPCQVLDPEYIIP